MSLSKKGAGQLIDLVAFDKRVPTVDDGYGNLLDGWVEQFQQRAGLTPVKGSEGIQASRLEGRQPYILLTRKSAQSSLVTTDWRCRDVRRGVEFNVRTITTDSSREMLEMLVESGVAEG